MPTHNASNRNISKEVATECQFENFYACLWLPYVTFAVGQPSGSSQMLVEFLCPFPCFNPIVKQTKTQSFCEQREIMSRKTRKKNETEDCYEKKRVVMSGGTSAGSKIFIILP